MNMKLLLFQVGNEKQGKMERPVDSFQRLCEYECIFVYDIFINKSLYRKFKCCCRCYCGYLSLSSSSSSVVAVVERKMNENKTSFFFFNQHIRPSKSMATKK